MCALSLSLMTCTRWFQLILASFGWYVIPVGHFPQKSLSKNPKIGFFSLPTIRPYPLTHDPSLPILAGYRLVVPGSRACFTFFTRHSCICRVLEIRLYVLSCTFGFLWRGLFSNLPSLWLASFGDWALLDHGPSFPRPILCSLYGLVNIFLLYYSIILTVMLLDSILLGLFGSAIYFPPSDSVYSLGLFLHCLWAPVSHLPLGHPWPICFPWTSSAFFQSCFLMGLY